MRAVQENFFNFLTITTSLYKMAFEIGIDCIDNEEPCMGFHFNYEKGRHKVNIFSAASLPLIPL